MFYLSLWKELFKAQFKSISTYRLDFYFGAFSLVFLDIPIYILIWVVFSNIKSFLNWTLFDMLLLNSTIMLINSISDCFEGYTRHIGELISTGDFDNFLLRPVNSFMLILCSNVQIEAMVSFIFSSGLSIFCIYNIQQLCNLLMILLYILHITLATILTSSLIFFISSLSFWFIGLRNTWNLINYGFEYIKYPMNIYPKFIQILLKWIIPLGFVGPITIYTFINYDINKCINVIIIEILLCLFWIIIDIILWKNGIKKYQSTGS